MKSIESIDKTAKSISAFDSINYGVYSVHTTRVHGPSTRLFTGGQKMPVYSREHSLSTRAVFTGNVDRRP